MKCQGDTGLYLSGSPVPIPMCMIYVTQPKIKDIIQFNETDFLMGVQLLTHTEDFLGDIRSAGNSELAKLSDFQILLVMIDQDPSIKKYLNTLFELIFPEYNLKYTKNSIDFSLREDAENQLIGQITPFTFESFQKVLKELFGLQTDDNKDYNPANAAAAEIAKKLKVGQDKKNKLQNKKTDKNVSLFGSYASILAIGMGMDINIFFGYTPFQLYDTFQRYWLKSKYDFYQKLVSTPMMDTSKMEEPEEWTKDLYN